METFFKLIDESPADDPSRFFISGGLEPLTNPDLSKLIIKLKEKKFNASMYTNGYMLTKKYLEKNDAIFNLDSLRISYYGINSEDTFKVTKKKQAFEIVNHNINNYLIEKEIRNSETSFGINCVILKNQSSDVINLLKIFSDINKKVNNNKNNFNFLTLREDFRILGERMTLEEREILRGTFKNISEYINKDKILSNLFIDYGFALEPIRNGYIGEKLEDNFASKEDLEILGVPQARVVVDLLGDVYLFGEAGFLDRPGAKKYIIGNLIQQGSMENVITNFINSNKNIEILESDRDFLDAWDHIAIKFANQQKDNLKFGILNKDSAINIQSINSIIKSNYKVHYSV
jgi:dTDP-4-amino-4,6-dideoxy-D-glucose ammonia-lyase